MSSLCRAVIIDDEDWIREGLSENIRWEVLQVELAGSFAQALDALDYIQNHPVQIILTDIRMPLMTGLEMLARLHESVKTTAGNAFSLSVKTIFLSGYDDFKYAQEALKLGAVDYLLKPADVSEIESSLARAKQMWMAEQHHKLPLPTVGDDEENPVSYLVKKSLQLMREKYAEDLQISQIADEVFVTPNYLSRLFRQETGLSYSDQLSKIRFEKACELLSTSLLKIYQIGQAVGLTNPRYFSEWFQKQSGMTPGEYRNRHIQ